MGERATSNEQQATTCASLYIHIPFCRAKCPYCHFYSRTTSDSLPALALKERRRERRTADYFQRLKQELMEYKGKAGPFSTIYFGGGTPTLAPAQKLASLIDFVDREFGICAVARACCVNEIEITIEANPEGLTLNYLRELQAAGVNRLSIGCQSFADKELKALGRRHRGGNAMRAFELARRAGFANINIDLMGGIPGTRPQHLERNIEEAVALVPEHISVYLLDQAEDGGFLAGRAWGEEDEINALEMVQSRLGGAGYRNYELSNHALAGYECRHNLVYWRGGEYIGLGPSACSFLDGRRHKNAADIDGYLAGVGRREEEGIDRATALRERVMLGLRLEEGLAMDELAVLCGRGWHDFRGRVSQLAEIGLLSLEEGRITLTSSGRPLADRIAVELF